MTSSKKPSKESLASDNLYAIAETSGQQFWFEVDKYYDIDRLNAKEKDKITIDKILLIKNKDNVSIGKPPVNSQSTVLNPIYSAFCSKYFICYKKYQILVEKYSFVYFLWIRKYKAQVSL